MKKQTKLVAVLSTAALLAIGASMTSFAATGWAEEDGTWVYYDRNGDKVTDKWAKSGNNWYYLDNSGEMAIDQLIEDGDNYYYVDVNGVMAANQWVAIENEDAGDEDEPEVYWYYFQANGKAMKNTTGKVALKTINGKKYTFDDEGKMLYGWVNENNEHQDNTDGDAFKFADYYFGDENDGAMTTGWLLTDITYSEATEDAYKFTGAAFSDDEDQTRWFYFKSNGKKVKKADTSDDLIKGKTINGKKYAFDEYGTMVAEWTLDAKEASANLASRGNAKYSQLWKYFNSVEDGSRVTKGWFKVVAAENLDKTRYDDDEENWYYADGSGNIYAGEFKTIKGKKYAFQKDGRMVSGLKFINLDTFDVCADDKDGKEFDTEDGFMEHAPEYFNTGYNLYYFGNSSDGAMKTGKTNITIDGDSFNFYLDKSGSTKGAGYNGEKDDKLYLAGMMLKAGSDDKYQVAKLEDGCWTKVDGAEKFINEEGIAHSVDADDVQATLDTLKISKKAKDIKELYTVDENANYKLINTSGKIVDKSGKSKDGNDFVYVTKGENIVAIYVEK